MITSHLSKIQRIFASLAIALSVLVAVVHPATTRAQEVPPGHLPDSITVTRGVKDGRKFLTFHVDATHSFFRYYDKIGTSWDRSGGSCYKNRVWFELYVADSRNDDEPARESYNYTFREREEGAKVCFTIAFGDYRQQGGAAGYDYGPFSFDRDPLITGNQQAQAETTPVTKPDPKPETTPAPVEPETQPQNGDDGGEAPETQREPEAVSSAPEGYKRPASLPLITSRPITAPPAESAEPDPSPEPLPEPDLAPQPDQSQPVAAPEVSDVTPDETPLAEVEVEVVDQADDATVAGSPESARTDQPSNSETSPNLRNTRAVLWGIVAAMATLLLLGSFVFRPKDKD